MRKFKVILWIFVLYILQTAFGGVIAINNNVPNLLLGFAIIFSFREREFSAAAYVFTACAILVGSCVDHSFALSVLVIGIGSIFAHLFAERAKFVPKFLRTFLVVVLASFVLAIFEYFGAARTLDVVDITKNTLQGIIYTIGAACVMYPIIAVTLFRRQEKKLLVV